MDQDKIDFVMIWVDGSDKEWLNEKAKYSDDPNSVLNAENRYRDWGLLKYWFRGVEKFAPWVNNVYFITCGHYPKWLNLKHPKLKFLKHEDYMPKEYLPTFSSHPIELNLHRIAELSEKFVYFNDDLFIINELEKNDFFIENKPKYIACCDIIHSESYADQFPHIILNDCSIINRYYNKKEVIKNDFIKWFNYRYGLKLFIKNLSMIPYNRFSNIYEPHIGTPILKSTMKEVWNKEYNILDLTSKNKFRGKEDVNQYIFKWLDICRGNFEPSNVIGKYFDIVHERQKLIDSIKNQKYKMVCFGDDMSIDFEKTKKEILECFGKILPEKSKFEM